MIVNFCDRVVKGCELSPTNHVTRYKSLYDWQSFNPQDSPYNSLDTRKQNELWTNDDIRIMFTHGWWSLWQCDMDPGQTRGEYSDSWGHLFLDPVRLAARSAVSPPPGSCQRGFQSLPGTWIKNKETTIKDGAGIKILLLDCVNILLWFFLITLTWKKTVVKIWLSFAFWMKITILWKPSKFLNL